MAQFGQIINMYQRAYASSARIFGLMDNARRLEEAEDAPPLAVTDGRVAYEDVVFSYDGDDEPVLRTSHSRPTAARRRARRPDWCGKIDRPEAPLRMYDVDYGSVRIDGQTCRTYRYRASVAPSATSVRRRSCSTAPSARTSLRTFDATDEEIVAAAEAAEADQFVRTFRTATTRWLANAASSSRAASDSARHRSGDPERPRNSHSRRGHLRRGHGDGNAHPALA